MKTVCLACNKPLEMHKRITPAIVALSQDATYEKPINGFYAPLSPKTIGTWMGHDPLMSTEPITWQTPFGATETQP